MNNRTQISNWLKSGEYKSQIDSVLTKIIRDCEHSAMKHTLHQFLKQRYTIL